MSIKSFVVLTIFYFSMLGSIFAAELPPVDINTATAEQIAEALSGVSETKAKRIVSFRDQHGPFKSVDDLVKVKGIGEKTVEKNRARIKPIGSAQ